MTNAQLLNLSWVQVLVFGLAYFTLLYVGFGALTLGATRWLLPRLRHGAVLDGRALPAGRHLAGYGQSSGGWQNKLSDEGSVGSWEKVFL